MKKILCFSFVLLVTNTVFAQKTAAPGQVFQYVEQMPEPGVSMSSYLSSHIKYPADAMDANIEGRVVVRFVVNEDGSVSDVIVTKSVYPSLDSVAKNVISEMPNWKPGKQNGKLVKVYFTQPISFKLPPKPKEQK